jgi:hypothetical protein
MSTDYNPRLPCPCGSGRRYKSCCQRRGIKYVTEEDGTIMEVKELSAETAELLQQVLEERRNEIWQKEGREMGPDDLLFPEFAETGEQGVIDMVAGIMERAELDPELIYAFRRTGILPTEDNLDEFSERELDEWEAAVEEYRRIRN